MQANGGIRLSRRSIMGFVLTTLTTAALLVLLFVRLLGASQQVVNASAGSPLIGHPAPAFTLPLWTGAPGARLQLAALRGHPVVINFFASWCVPCQEEAPVLNAAARRYQAQGVVFIGVVYQDSRQNAMGFVQQERIPYAVGPDSSGAIAVNYGVSGIPETVFINQEGVITFKFGGALDQDTLDTHIQALLR